MEKADIMKFSGRLFRFAK